MRRGLTLAEVLLYLVLLGLYFSGVYATLTLAWRFYFQAQGQRDAVAQAARACNELGRALACGAGSSFAYQTDPPACVVLSAQPASLLFEVDDTGTLLWQKWIGFHFNESSRELRRTEVPLTSATTALPAAPDFVTLFSQPSQPVAQHIIGLNLTQSFPQQVFVYQVTTEVPSFQGTRYRVVLEGHFATRQ